MFSPKEEEDKQRAEERKRRKEKIQKLNAKIIELDTHVFKETARLNDDNLIDKQKQENMVLMQEFSKIEIDMNIARSRI